MKSIMMTLLFSLFVSNMAFAADNTCEAKAAEKKLAGAAKDSFVKKCLKDTAKPDCTKLAEEKKLSGAAKNSFIKKCEKTSGR